VFNVQGGAERVELVRAIDPFISFDAISYAAGLTNLTQARFAAATSVRRDPNGVRVCRYGHRRR